MRESTCFFSNGTKPLGNTLGEESSTLAGVKLGALLFLRPKNHVHCCPQRGDSCLPAVQGFSQLFHIRMTVRCAGRHFLSPFTLGNAWKVLLHPWPGTKRNQILAPCHKPRLKSRPARPLSSGTNVLTSQVNWRVGQLQGRTRASLGSHSYTLTCCISVKAQRKVSLLQNFH